MNDLEEFLLESGDKCLDLKDEELREHLQLMVLMYADDTVLLADNPKALQSMLDHLKLYCDKWKLSVNEDKTKVMIFRKRKSKVSYNFKFDGNVLEIVDHFKYLGVTFKYNSNFDINKKELKQKAQRAMFSLLSKGRRLKLPIDIQLELFDRTITPILTYGSEVWGYENTDILESVHMKFCKFLLNVKQSTPNCMIYAELGRYPINIAIKVGMIQYWKRLLIANDRKLTKIMYYYMLWCHLNQMYTDKWLMCVRDILYRNGMGYLWENQEFACTMNIKYHIQERLQCQFEQCCMASIRSSSKCTLYKEVKIVFELEKYLVCLPRSLYIYLTKLRLSSHKLPIETGRYNNTPRELRVCDMCSDNVLGDEYHLILECNNNTITNLRNLHLPKDIVSRPSMYSFTNMLKSLHNDDIGVNLAIFLKMCKCL